jgi:hypothetical protein
VDEAISILNSSAPIAPGSSWDTPLIRKDVWFGQWENDTGFWIIIDEIGNSFFVYRSGDPPTKLHFISMISDNKVLNLEDGTRWALTLTLKNDNQAELEWRHKDDGSLWQTETMHKLGRSAPR